jgi:hypothetical protein
MSEIPQAMVEAARIAYIREWMSGDRPRRMDAALAAIGVPEMLACVEALRDIEPLLPEVVRMFHAAAGRPEFNDDERDAILRGAEHGALAHRGLLARLAAFDAKVPK